MVNRACNKVLLFFWILLTNAKSANQAVQTMRKVRKALKAAKAISRKKGINVSSRVAKNLALPSYITDSWVEEMQSSGIIARATDVDDMSDIDDIMDEGLMHLLDEKEMDFPTDSGDLDYEEDMARWRRQLAIREATTAESTRLRKMIKDVVKRACLKPSLFELASYGVTRSDDDMAVGHKAIQLALTNAMLLGFLHTYSVTETFRSASSHGGVRSIQCFMATVFFGFSNKTVAFNDPALRTAMCVVNHPSSWGQVALFEWGCLLAR